MLKRLWLDEGGAILSTELILLLVIVVIGVSVGLVVLRDAVVSEIEMVASAINAIDPGFSWSDLVYTNNDLVAGAIAQGTNATATPLLWGPGTGLANIEVEAGVNELAADDPLLVTGVIQSP